jgi:hypothetical protein
MNKLSTNTGLIFTYKPTPEKSVQAKLNPETLVPGEVARITEGNTTNKITLANGTKPKDNVLVFLTQLANPIDVMNSQGAKVGTLTQPGFYYFVWDNSAWRMM